MSTEAEPETPSAASADPTDPVPGSPEKPRIELVPEGLRAELAPTLEPDEKVFWIGRPVLFAIMLPTIWPMLGGTAAMIGLRFIQATVYDVGLEFQLFGLVIYYALLVAAGLIILAPLWTVLLAPLALFALTDRRVVVWLQVPKLAPRSAPVSEMFEIRKNDWLGDTGTITLSWLDDHDIERTMVLSGVKPIAPVTAMIEAVREFRNPELAAAAKAEADPAMVMGGPLMVGPGADPAPAGASPPAATPQPQPAPQAATDR